LSKWSKGGRTDEEMVKLMAKSGCYYFAYGIESANPEILRNIKKKETIGEIEKAIEIAEKNGISCQGFFIFGLPGETVETIKQTIDFVQKSRLSRAQFLILDVLPGSELWYNLEGKFIPNWRKNSYKEPEWLPNGLSKEDLLMAQSEAFRRFYLNPKRFFKLIKLVDLKQLGYLIKRLKDYRLLPRKN